MSRRIGPALPSLLALLLVGSPAAPARASPRVTAIEFRGSMAVDGGTAEETEVWFRDGCFVRQTRAPLPDRGLTRIDEVGCVAAGVVGKLFEDADRRASRPGLVRGRSAAASPIVTADGEEIPDTVLMLGDGTRWRARDVESAADLHRLHKTLAETGRSTARSLSLVADGTSLSAASRSAQVFVGLGADGRWRCSRVLSEKMLGAKSKRPPPRRPRAGAAATVARLLDSLLESVTPGNLLPREDTSKANSAWGTLTVEVTFDDKSTGRLEATSAVRIAERLSVEAARLSSLCTLP